MVAKIGALSLLFTLFFVSLAVAAEDDPAASPKAARKSVAELVQQLKDGPDRAAAADALGRLKEEANDASSALAAALQAEDIELRWKAARSLASIRPQDQATVQLLTAALQDPNAKVRAYVVLALGNIGPAAISAAPVLVKVITDKDPAVRRAVINALRKIDKDRSEVHPLLIEVFQKGEPAAVLAALRTLAEGGSEVVPNLVEALNEEDSCYWACLALAEIGPEAKDAVGPLLESLKRHGEPEVRMQTLVTLGEIGVKSEASSAAISAILDGDQPAGVKYAAAFALSKIGIGDTAKASLERASKSDDELLQLISAWALVKLEPENKAAVKRSVEFIVRGLKSKNEHHRSIAARALAESDVPSEVSAPIVEAALADASPETVSLAIDALVAQGAKAVPRLSRGLQNETLRGYAVDALRRLGPEAAGAVSQLAVALSAEGEDAADFRREVLFALAAIGEKSAPAVDAITKAIDDDAKEVRYAACYALGKIGPEAKPALQRLLKAARSDDAFLKFASVWAIVKIVPRNQRINRVAATVLSKALAKAESDRMKIEIADTLSGMGEAASVAIPALEAELQSDNPQVREAVKNALEKLRG